DVARLQAPFDCGIDVGCVDFPSHYILNGINRAAEVAATIDTTTPIQKPIHSASMIPSLTLPHAMGRLHTTPSDQATMLKQLLDFPSPSKARRATALRCRWRGSYPRHRARHKQGR